MLAIIILIIALFSPSFYISIKKNIAIERVIPATIFSIILIIYVFGLVKLLKIGVYFVFLLVLLSLIANMVERTLDVNNNISEEQLKNLVARQYQVIKIKKQTTNKEIQDVFKKYISKYVMKINEKK